MAYGLVLEGGGAKGSYQLGAYMAVQEMKPDIRLVVGTSIGALNGAFIVQGNTDELARIWSKISFDNGGELSSALVEIKKGIDPVSLAKTARAMRRVDLEPLKELIHRHIDEEAIRKSSIDYGLVVYSVSEAKTKFLYLEDIPKGRLGNYILASCCYPVFAPVKIDGKFYADGGIGNNLPYEMVLARDLDPIILRTNPPKGEVFPENSIVIGPTQPIAETMHFDPDLASRRMHIGYRHGRRILGGYDGMDYIFYPFSEREALKRLDDLFFAATEDFRYLVEEKGSPERGIHDNLWPKLADALHLGEEYSYKELLLGLVEARADQLHMDRDKIYTLDGLLDAMGKKGDVRPPVESMVERVLYLLFRGKRLAIE